MIFHSGNVPNIIVYFDATNECHDLSFNFGQSAIGTTTPTRSFTIKVRLKSYLLVIKPELWKVCQCHYQSLG